MRRLFCCLPLLVCLGACAGNGATDTSTDVNYLNGDRVDVPDRDLSRDHPGLLKNGITPQPLGFD